MSPFASPIGWCVLQVTLLSGVGLMAATLLRRWKGDAAGTCLRTVLLAVLVLTVLAGLPGQSWLVPPAPISPTAIRLGETAAEKRGEPFRPANPVTAEGSTNKTTVSLPSTSPTSEPTDEQLTQGTAVLWQHLAGGWNRLVRELEPVPETASLPAKVSEPVPVASPRRLDWKDLAVGGIFACVVLGLLRLLIGWVAVRKQLRRARRLEDDSIRESVAALAAALSFQRPVAICETPELSTAATVGWRRPVILLPVEWRTWTPDERQAVLAHELAHIASRHYPQWILAQFTLTLHFYHPLVHWLAAKLRLEQEYEADRLAASLTGGAKSYLERLAVLAIRQSDGATSWPVRAFLPTRRTFLRRIEMLRGITTGRAATWPVRIAIVGLVIAVGVGVAGLRSPSNTPIMGITTTDSAVKVVTYEMAAADSPASSSEPAAPKEITDTAPEFSQTAPARQPPRPRQSSIPLSMPTSTPAPRQANPFDKVRPPESRPPVENGTIPLPKPDMSFVPGVPVTTIHLDSTTLREAGLPEAERGKVEELAARVLQRQMDQPLFQQINGPIEVSWIPGDTVAVVSIRAHKLFSSLIQSLPASSNAPPPEGKPDTRTVELSNGKELALLRSLLSWSFGGSRWGQPSLTEWLQAEQITFVVGLSDLSDYSQSKSIPQITTIVRFLSANQKREFLGRPLARVTSVDLTKGNVEIDRGSSDGVRPGERLNLFHSGIQPTPFHVSLSPNQEETTAEPAEPSFRPNSITITPRKHVGVVQVVSVDEKIAKCRIVERVNGQIIKIGDITDRLPLEPEPPADGSWVWKRFGPEGYRVADGRCYYDADEVTLIIAGESALHRLLLSGPRVQSQLVSAIDREDVFMPLDGPKKSANPYFDPGDAQSTPRRSEASHLPPSPFPQPSTNLGTEGAFNPTTGQPLRGNAAAVSFRLWQKPASPPASEDWPSLSKDAHVLAAVDMEVLSRILPTDSAAHAPFLPLWTQSRTLVLGLQYQPKILSPQQKEVKVQSPSGVRNVVETVYVASNEQLNLLSSIHCENSKDADAVFKTLDAAAVLARNMLRGGRLPAPAHPPDSIALSSDRDGSVRWLTVFQTALNAVTVRPVGNSVTVHASLPVDDDLFALLRHSTISVPAALGLQPTDQRLKTLGVAFHDYYDLHGHFPPAVLVDPESGVTRSWRVELLPLLGLKNLYDQYHKNRPWDSPANRAVLEAAPHLFGRETSLMAVVGRGTVFEPMLNGHPPKGTSLRSITDGTSNTILLVAHPSKAVPWTQPEDVTISRADWPADFSDLKELLKGNYPVVLADSSVRHVKADPDAKQFARYLLKADGVPARSIFEDVREWERHAATLLDDQPIRIDDAESGGLEAEPARKESVTPPP